MGADSPHGLLQSLVGSQGLKPSGAPRSSVVLLASAAAATCLVLCLRLLAAPLAGVAAGGERVDPPRRAGEGGAGDLAAAADLLAAWPEDKPRACILILARNSDLHGVLSSVGQLERRFNAAPHARYPYCYLNDRPFSLKFRAAVTAATAAPCFFGLVPQEHWSYPPHINVSRAAELRQAARRRMPYGGSESYRFMCRYFSGFFFDHPLLEGFDWYWRVEPDVHFMCNLPGRERDPFRHMQASNQSLAWTIVMDEVPSTIPSLWPEVQQWLADNPQHVAPGNLLPALLEEERPGGGGGGTTASLAIDRPRLVTAALAAGGGKATQQQRQRVLASPYGRSRFTGCHFWSNFEVGRLSFFRSKAYRSFFAHLDAGTGFFYERWGDAPVHTLAAAALLHRDQIHFARDIGYKHGSWAYCPSEPEDRPRCDCHPSWDSVALAQPHCQWDFRTRLQALQLAEE